VLAEIVLLPEVNIWDEPKSAVAGVGRKVLQALAEAPKEEVAHDASSFDENSGVACCPGRVLPPLSLSLSLPA
jgi:hypothetical protein